MHRFLIPACQLAAFSILAACSGLNAADVPLQTPEDPWRRGLDRVGEDLRHRLCELHRSFRGVGDLPGGGFGSGVSGVAQDGARAVGKSESSTPAGEGFTWTRPGSSLKFWPTSSGDGIQPLGFYVAPNGQPGIESEGTQVSADGKVVVGGSKTPDALWHAVKWTTNGVELIPEPGNPWTDRSEAFGVSGDGSVIAGMGTTSEGVFGFRWTVAHGTELLIQAPAGVTLDSSWADGVSDDGTTIVGRSVFGGEQVPNACAWRSSTPGGVLTAYRLSTVYSEAYAVSANGSVAVGYASNGDAFNVEACWWQWDQSAGTWGPAKFLGKLAGTSGSLALDIDAEGRAVGGYCYSDSGELGAVWFLDSALNSPGPHHVSTLLSSVGITAHAGWSIEIVSGVTIDPNRVLVLVGAGVNPDHQSEGWIAHVPPWCLTPRPPKFEPNVPFLWPEPWHTFPGGPIDPLRGPRK